MKDMFKKVSSIVFSAIFVVMLSVTVPNKVSALTEIPSILVNTTGSDDTLLTKAKELLDICSINKIKSVNFVDLYKTDTTGLRTADFSANGDRSVIAWFDSAKQALYIGGYGEVHANTSLAYAFYRANYLESITGLDMLDVSHTTDMEKMFAGCGAYSTNFSLDLGYNFDTSNVTNMEGMFSGVGFKSKTFTLNLGTRFDTSKVVDMDAMFTSAGHDSTAFTLDLGSHFNTANVKYMNGMFAGCGYTNPSFTLNLGPQFSTASAVDMMGMFGSCGYNSTVWKSLDLSGFTVKPNTKLDSFAANIPVDKFTFGPGWENASLPTAGSASSAFIYQVPGKPELPTTLTGAPQNILSYAWKEDHRPLKADTPTPTPNPTPSPTAAPTAAPTPAPTPAPTAAPTPAPTAAPTPAPTAAPTPAPTAAPTPAPTAAPTPAPTAAPTPAPTAAPTPAPTAAPTPAPTAAPTPSPSPAPAGLDFTSIRTARANTIAVNHKTHTITMNSDTNVSSVLIYKDQLEVIPGGIVTLADKMKADTSLTDEGFTIANNGRVSSVMVNVTVGGVTEQYKLSVSFSAFVGENLRMYQRRIGYTEKKNIIYGNKVGYVSGDEIHIIPDADVDYIGLIKRQGTPGHIYGIITPVVTTYPKYKTETQSRKARDPIFVDWQDCIFVKRPTDSDEVRFKVNYELNGQKDEYTVIVDYSKRPAFDFTTLRTKRVKSLTVDQAKQKITIDAKDGASNVAIFRYQIAKIPYAVVTPADANDATIVPADSDAGYYIESDGRTTVKTAINVTIGYTTRRYEVTVNFKNPPKHRAFHFKSIRNRRAAEVNVDHAKKEIVVHARRSQKNVALFKHQKNVIRHGRLTLADIPKANVIANNGSYYVLQTEGAKPINLKANIKIGSRTRQYKVKVVFDR